MNEEELREFLGRALTATVSTVGPGGRPHAVPVWYRFREGVFVMWTDASRRWVKNLYHRPDVSIVVAEPQPPFAAVVARGSAEIATEEPVGNEDVRLLVERYVGVDEAAAYIEQWSMLKTVVRVRAERVRSWGRGY